MSEENNNDQAQLTKEDLEALNADIKKTKESLVTKESQDAIERAKQQAKEEAVKEFELQKKLEDQERKNKELEERLANQEKIASEKLDQLKGTVDKMLTSKQVIANKDPFASGGDVAMSSEIDRWSDDKVNQFEEASKRAFFGDDYDDRV